jgi:hypothetical protein
MDGYVPGLSESHVVQHIDLDALQSGRGVRGKMTLGADASDEIH